MIENLESYGYLKKHVLKRVLEKINMGKAKSIYSPLVGRFKLSFEHYPISEKEK